MKKIFLFLLFVIIAFSITACNFPNDDIPITEYIFCCIDGIRYYGYSGWHEAGGLPHAEYENQNLAMFASKSSCVYSPVTVFPDQYITIYIFNFQEGICTGQFFYKDTIGTDSINGAAISCNITEANEDGGFCSGTFTGTTPDSRPITNGHFRVKRDDTLNILFN